MILSVSKRDFYEEWHSSVGMISNQHYICPNKKPRSRAKLTDTVMTIIVCKSLDLWLRSDVMSVLVQLTVLPNVFVTVTSLSSSVIT